MSTAAHASQGGPEATELLAGYRIVRRIGGTDRAVVHVATTTAATSPIAHAPRVLKVYSASAHSASIDAEIEALERARGEHIVELVDIATAPDGLPVLVLARVPGPSIARLLADRGAISMGEAVTLAAPIAATVSRMHRTGVVHSAIRATAVLIDERGAPVLCCFGAAEVITPNPTIAALEVDPGVRRDNEGLAALVAAILAHVGEAEFAHAIDDLDEWMRDTIYHDPAGFALALENRLFELADASPLRHRSELALRPAPLSAGVATGARSREMAVPHGGLPNDADAAAARGSRVSRVSRVSRALTTSISRGFSAMRRHAGTVRPRFWMAAAAVGVLATTAFALTGTAPITGSGDEARERAPSIRPTEATPLQSESSFDVGTHDVAPAVDHGSSIAGDDPVLAIDALLRERADCFVELSLACLDAVDQGGSIALDDDRTAIVLVRDGGEVPQAFGSPSTAPAPTLTQRLGDTALVSLGADTPPASALMVRSEAGWRIRELLDD